MEHLLSGHAYKTMNNVAELGIGGQVLMTREYRARLAAGGSGGPKRAATHAAVRVRLPEGILLQGEFNAGEPVCPKT